MRKKPLGILIISFVLCALCTVADTSAFARGGGHGGGGHGGGGHGHGGGGHGHGGGHRGSFHGHAFGGHRGGRHFAHHGFGGHNFARRRFATHGGPDWAGHHVAGHGFRGHRNFTHSGAGHGLTGSRFAAGARLAHNQQHFHSLSNFSRTGFNRNTFGNGPGWDGWGRSFWGAGWNYWGSGWGGWAGPVFWPFLVGDILSFALWPYAYYDPFWAFGPDFVLASIFAPGPYYGLGYGYGRNYYGYGGVRNIYSGSYGGPGYGYGRTNQVAKSLKNREVDREALAETNAAAVQSCSGLAPGITDLPIGQIRQTIHPTAEQVAALDDLSGALSKADATVATSCPQEAPLTPVGRLDAAEQRLAAMIQAIQIVRSPLERFDESLNEEQRQRFDAMSNTRRANGERVAETGGNLATACSQQAGDFINVPVQRVDQVIQPTAQQQDAFDQLKKVSENAAGMVQASCPTQMPRTPTARLDAVKTRLGAMVDAMKAVRPKLEQF
jgi:LTXXQ motif family protein